MTLPRPLVETGWLADHLGEQGLVVIDASWRMPGAGSAIDDYAKRHIPGAVFFDIDEIADRETSLPHMLPAPAEFERAVSRLGVSSGDKIVVYDDAGIFSAARVWWTFRAMRHEAVAVLNGGLPKWLSENRGVATAAVPRPPRPPGVFEARLRADLVRDAKAVRRAIEYGSARIVDARPAGRFEGRDPEPRPGLRRGHMPGAKSIPFAEVLIDGRLRSEAELRAIFAARGVGEASSVVATCGSGVTASVLALALEQIGHRRYAVYDGSWTEWGDETNDPAKFPVATGA